MTNTDASRITAQLNACNQAMSALRAYDRGVSDSGCTDAQKLRIRAEFQFKALKALSDAQKPADPSNAEWAWLLEKHE